jgi:hypothetical protein
MKTQNNALMTKLKSFFQIIKKPLLTIAILTLLLTIVQFEVMMINNLNPLIFGSAFFIVNRKKINANIFIGLLLSVGASYVAFFAGFLSFFGFTYAIDQATTSIISPEFFIVISGLIACLTLYLLFARICKTGQRKKGILITISSYLLVPIIVLIFPIIFLKPLKNGFFMLYNLIWLFVVGFFMTLTINLENKKFAAA